MKKSAFDRQYYQRFYLDDRTRVASQRDISRLGNFVCSYVKYLRIPVGAVLDIGCGLGYWKPVISRHFPSATYQGVERSLYLCRQLGWKRGSVVDFSSKQPFDLVICQGVLQYLTDAEATRAIENLAKLTCGGLYLEALTEEDWKSVCDQSTTDGEVFRRKAAWYRERLERHFISVGGGVFISRSADAAIYELEKA